MTTKIDWKYGFIYYFKFDLRVVNILSRNFIVFRVENSSMFPYLVVMENRIFLEDDFNRISYAGIFVFESTFFADRCVRSGVGCELKF